MNAAAYRLQRSAMDSFGFNAVKSLKFDTHVGQLSKVVIFFEK
jgi:hypothetical protein